jgi:hypothetical protein
MRTLRIVNASTEPSGRFLEALESIRAATLPAEAVLHEIPAPTRAATYAVALEVHIPAGEGEDASSGSFVVLHETGGHAVWDGDFRIVTVAKAQLESEMGADPFLSEVAWCWLAEAIEASTAPWSHLAGTVTRTLSESFGDLKIRGDEVGVEVRASWTPHTPDVGSHLEAWIAFVARLGGVDLLPTGVVRLASRR